MTESEDYFKLESFKKIFENSFEQQKLVVKGLKTILENVINNPLNNEFRRVHLLSENVVENLMPFNGGLEFLFELGFVEDEENLILPMTVNLNKVKYNLDQLTVFFNKKPSSLPSPPTTTTKSIITRIIPKRTDYPQISEQVLFFEILLDKLLLFLLVYF